MLVSPLGMRNEDQFVDEYGSGGAGAHRAYPGHYGSVKSLKLKCVSADESVLALVHCSTGSDQRMQIKRTIRSRVCEV